VERFSAFLSMNIICISLKFAMRKVYRAEEEDGEEEDEDKR